METRLARQERGFRAFADQGDQITFETYTGGGRRLAAIRGQDPDAAVVAKLTEELERMWEQFQPMADTNGDGRIDRDEWLAFAAAATAASLALGPDDDWMLDSYIRRLFDVIDADGDGRITPSEYGDWLASMGLAADTDVEGAFANLDADGNGTLSWEEFSACSRNYWLTDDPDIPGARWMGP